MTILFVCTGNTCRSPLAWARWRALQGEGKAPAAWSAFSAGLAPSAGEPASPYAMDIARGWGVDLSEHRSRPLDAGALQQVDACVAISPSHAASLSRMLGSLGKAPRLLCLSDFLPRAVPRFTPEEAVARLLGEDGTAGREIADPYGGSREAYQACAALIAPAVARLAIYLQEESSGASSSSQSQAASQAPEANAPEPS